MISRWRRDDLLDRGVGRFVVSLLAAELHPDLDLMRPIQFLHGRKLPGPGLSLDGQFFLAS